MVAHNRLSFFFQAEDGIRDGHVTGVQTCALPISSVFICVHQWLQSVVPMVSICVYPCSSVVAICGSNGFHPCLSVFIGGCNLCFHWCLSVFIRVHQWLQSVVPTVSIRAYPCSSVRAISVSVVVTS